MLETDWIRALASDPCDRENTSMKTIDTNAMMAAYSLIPCPDSSSAKSRTNSLTWFNICVAALLSADLRKMTRL